MVVAIEKTSEEESSRRIELKGLEPSWNSQVDEPLRCNEPKKVAGALNRALPEGPLASGSGSTVKSPAIVMPAAFLSTSKSYLFACQSVRTVKRRSAAEP